MMRHQTTAALCGMLVLALAGCGSERKAARAKPTTTTETVYLTKYEVLRSKPSELHHEREFTACVHEVIDRRRKASSTTRGLRRCAARWYKPGEGIPEVEGVDPQSLANATGRPVDVNDVDTDVTLPGPDEPEDVIVP